MPPAVNTLGEFYAADARCDKKKDTPQRSSSSMVPSLLNDMPFVNSVPQPPWVVNTLRGISCCPCKNKPPSNGRVVQRTLPFHISMAYTDSIADFLSDVKGKVGFIPSARTDLVEKSTCIAGAFFYGVSSGSRTHDLQGHNLAL